MQYNQYSDKLSIDIGSGLGSGRITGGHLDKRSISPYPKIPFPDDSSYGTISPFPSIPPPSQMEYVTIQGNVIRSVIPPGKGVHIDYGKVTQGYAPRPFNQGPVSPPSGSQRSPGAPGAPSWSQPKSAPVAQSPYATLPRTAGSQGPAGSKPPPPGAIQVLPNLPPPVSAVKHQFYQQQQQQQQSSPAHVIFPPTPDQLMREESFKQKQISTNTATAAASAAKTSTFSASSVQSAIASSASFASNQSSSSINTTNIQSNIDTKSAADTGSGARAGGAFGATSAPKRGRGILNKAVGPGSRIPQCGACQNQIRGPFITALGRIWCPEHFVCVNGSCRRPLQDIGFVEEKGDLYCEFCFEKYLAPTCSKCNGKIKGDCLNAIGKHFHPECFTCAYCGKIFGNTPFFVEDGDPYCEADWNELFTTKCFACGFPIEAGDRWVEALNHNYHSQCFNCSMCKVNLEGQGFFNKGGRPFCKNHAR